MTKRNIIISKAGGTAGKESVNYKISLPAHMVKTIGVTPKDRGVVVELEDGEIKIKKDVAEQVEDEK